MKPTLTLLTTLLLAPLAALHAADRPNFVWIIADDMSPDTAAYGVKQVSTPNLDRLAAEGCRYHACLCDRTGMQFVALRVYPRLLSDHDRTASA